MLRDSSISAGMEMVALGKESVRRPEKLSFSFEVKLADNKKAKK